MDKYCSRCGMAIVYESGDVPLSLDCARCGIANDLHINKRQDFYIVHLTGGEDIHLAEDCAEPIGGKE